MHMVLLSAVCIIIMTGLIIIIIIINCMSKERVTSEDKEEKIYKIDKMAPYT